MEEYKTDLTEEKLKKMMSDMMGKAVNRHAPVSITPYGDVGNLWCTRNIKGEVLAVFGEWYKNELEKAFEQAIKEEFSKQLWKTK